MAHGPKAGIDTRELVYDLLSTVSVFVSSHNGQHGAENCKWRHEEKEKAVDASGRRPAKRQRDFAISTDKSSSESNRSSQGSEDHS